MSPNNEDGKEAVQFTCELPKIPMIDGRGGGGKELRVICSIKPLPLLEGTMEERENKLDEALTKLEEVLEEALQNGKLPAKAIVGRTGILGLSVHLDGDGQNVGDLMQKAGYIYENRQWVAGDNALQNLIEEIAENAGITVYASAYRGPSRV